MKQRTLLHDGWIVAVVSFLCTLFMAASIYSRYGYFEPSAFRPVWILAGITGFLVLVLFVLTALHRISDQKRASR